MLVLLDGWMVVRFVGVTRVPLCARVSCVRPVCVPAPPGVFLPVRGNYIRSMRKLQAPCENIAPCPLRTRPARVVVVVVSD